jgi:predicted PurR-regulated permease PerM
MHFNKDWLNRPWVAYTIATCSAVVLFLTLSHIGMIFTAVGTFLGYFTSLLIGVIFAYLLNPVAIFCRDKIFRKLKNEKQKWAFSVVLAVVMFVTLFVLLLVTLIPQLVNSITVFAGNLQNYITGLSNQVNRGSGKLFGLIDYTSLQETLSNTLTKLSESMQEHAATILNTSYNVGSSIANVVIGFILSIYFLMDKERLTEGFRKTFRASMKEESYNSARTFVSRCDKILIRYIGFTILEGVIVGVVNAFMMGILQMPYISLVSVIVGVTNLAPTFGPIVGAAIGAFLLLLVQPKYALWFLILTLVLQTVDGYVLKPKLFGNSLGVPSVWILISIVLGGKFFGVPGILLAIPFAAIVNFIYQDSIETRLREMEGRKKKKGEEKAAE